MADGPVADGAGGDEVGRSANPGLGRDPERGSGTVLGLAVIGVALVLIAAVAGLGWSLQARSAAQSAADLGAIAGAQLLDAPGGTPEAACARARAVVVAGGAVLERCLVRGGVVEVLASVRATGLLTARAEARAGPVGQ